MPAHETVLTVDTGRWPLVVLTFAGRPTTADLTAHLAEIEELVLQRKLPFVQVIDQARAAAPDAMQRALIADHQTQQEVLYRAYCIGEVYVTSPRIRGAMVAVFWLAKPPYPYAFVDTRKEGIDWARSRLRSHGLR